MTSIEEMRNKASAKYKTKHAVVEVRMDVVRITKLLPKWQNCETRVIGCFSKVRVENPNCWRRTMFFSRTDQP